MIKKFKDKRRENRTEAIEKEIITKIYQISSETQVIKKSQGTPSSINTNRMTPEHIRLKLLKTEVEEIILKAVKRRE